MTWNHFIFFAIASVLFWAAGALAAWKGKNRTAVAATVAGLLAFFSFIIALWMSLERPPLRTMGETRLWYSLFLPFAGVAVFVRWRYKWILSFSTLLSAVFIGVNLLKPEIHNKTLMPALQSAWFAPHVIVYMFAYALLGAAAVMAVYLLFFKKEAPTADELDISDNLVYVGLSFMTLGMLMGALWAKEAWGIIGRGTRRKLGLPLRGWPIWPTCIFVGRAPIAFSRLCICYWRVSCCCRCVGGASIICPRHKGLVCTPTVWTEHAILNIPAARNLLRLFAHPDFILYLCPHETKCVDISAERMAEKGELFCIF